MFSVLFYCHILDNNIDLNWISNFSTKRDLNNEIQIYKVEYINDGFIAIFYCLL